MKLNSLWPVGAPRIVSVAVSARERLDLGIVHPNLVNHSECHRRKRSIDDVIPIEDLNAARLPVIILRADDANGVRLQCILNGHKSARIAQSD